MLEKVLFVNYCVKKCQRNLVVKCYCILQFEFIPNIFGAFGHADRHVCCHSIMIHLILALSLICVLVWFLCFL